MALTSFLREGMNQAFHQKNRKNKFCNIKIFVSKINKYVQI
jgi:hypothetical protein